MLRRLAIAASAIVLVVSVVIAGARSGATYTREEVVRAFAEHGYALTELTVQEFGSSWTGYGPEAQVIPGGFYFPRPNGNGPFYVLVARNDLVARQYFARLLPVDGEPVPGDGSFDLVQGNVVVSSDASRTPTGLTRDEQSRIRAALRLLDTTG